ncbi:hypothetical protein EDD85DRAFT_933957 [Armillaria nabsnona]|nr:hypothetical protein EDD85DRAFT_933957 [Armillaria nabsnona]
MIACTTVYNITNCTSACAVVGIVGIQGYGHGRSVVNRRSKSNLPKYMPFEQAVNVFDIIFRLSCIILHCWGIRKKKGGCRDASPAIAPQPLPSSPSLSRLSQSYLVRYVVAVADAIGPDVDARGGGWLEWGRKSHLVPRYALAGTVVIAKGPDWVIRCLEGHIGCSLIRGLIRGGEVEIHAIHALGVAGLAK